MPTTSHTNTPHTHLPDHLPPVHKVPDHAIIVTGATGFVGSHVLMALAGHPETQGRVVAACRDRTRLPPGYAGPVMEGNLRDPAYRTALAKAANTVFHAAAWTALYGHAPPSKARFLEPTLALLDAVRDHGVKRFIQVSTTAASPPEHAATPDAPANAPAFWPHLENVAKIETAMRERTEAEPGAECTMVALRFGLFVGERYALGLLPILVPRLKSRLVPWVAGGRTPMPLIGGEDIGEAGLRSVITKDLEGFHGFNIIGPETPSVRDVLTFLADTYDLPKPWFSVPFPLAHIFAGTMEALSHVTPFNPFISRSIIYLLRDFHVDNAKAERMLGYRARIPWQDAIRRQMSEMAVRQTRPMAMVVK